MQLKQYKASKFEALKDEKIEIYPDLIEMGRQNLIRPEKEDLRVISLWLKS